MMILLSGHSLTPEKRFSPEKVSVNLSERGSTASVTIPEDGPVLSVGDWVTDEQGPAAGIVWRVKTIDTQYERKTRTVSLEHAVNALRDRIMFGEVKPSDISGGSGNPTAKQAVQYILARQSDWTLGDFAYNSVTNPYSFNGDDLFSALETVSSSLEDCIWEYDFTSYPFKIHIRQLDSTVCSEMRTDRNIRTLKKTVDRSNMYTRIYPIGKNNLHIDGDYLSKHENLYGVVSKVETDQSKGSKAELQAWAQERLDRHCEPAVNVTISGLELEELTGESLDSFTIGKMCRVPLPEFCTTITERVVKLSYADTENSPMDVTVTLANEVRDVATILKEQAASGGRSGRAGALKDEEDHAWFVDTTDHVSMVAEAVAGKDENDQPNWSRVSELTVDGNGIDARVVHAEGEIVDAWSAIHMTETAITTEVSAAQSAIRSYVQQTASNILTVIENTESNLRSYTEQTASGLRSLLVSTTNQVWIQDSDPRSESGGSHEVKTGDVWIESTHQGTWDGAEGFDWDHDESYDWNQIQGAKVWGWQNNKWELVSDQQQVVTYRDVVDTADQYVRRYVAGIVNDEGMLEVYLARLEMTAQELRSDISAAGSTIYSSIQQTATNILLQVAYRPRTIVSKTQPASIDGRGLKEDDVWIESENAHNWEDLEDADWGDETAVEWNKLRSDTIHVYKDGKWQTALDGVTLLEDADIETDRMSARMYARKLETVDGQLQQYYAELKVESGRIRSRVEEYYNDVGSSITQTARQIRLEVHAAKSELWSEIVQTASNIRLEVASEASDIRSSIEMTASQIRSDVSAANSTIYSRITQQANRISLVVNGTGSSASIKAAAIVAAVNESGSTILLEADKIRLSGNTKITDILGVNSSGYMTVAGDIFENGVIHPTGVSVAQGGAISLLVGTSPPVTYSLDASTWPNAIKNASVSGNVLTLTKWNGDAVNFSKATALSGQWSGNGKLTVTAKQNNVEVAQFERLLSPGSQTKSGKNISIPINAVYGSQGQYTESTGFTVTANASGVYDDGQNAVNINKGSWSNGQIQFTKSAGTADTEGVLIGASGSWSGGNYTAVVKDYYDSQAGTNVGYTVTTDIGSPSTSNPSAQPGTASLSGRTQVGSNELSKASLSGPGYIFFSITVRGRELKYYIKLKA